MGHLLGYARVSTTDQHPQLQVDALKAAGCYRVFTETVSGARSDRPTLAQLLDQLLAIAGRRRSERVRSAKCLVELRGDLNP
jgi:predicted site-specific integrase-resolvase